mmetsp:Transcript_27149/g.79061  ORF Transcript_27149/g.79061 Transcript_27149/m.79061 type:complete len:496 (-) Transcript_27149:347-1834(-)
MEASLEDSLLVPGNQASDSKVLLVAEAPASGSLVEPKEQEGGAPGGDGSAASAGLPVPQTRRYRDPWMAILFVVHLVIIFSVAVALKPSSSEHSSSREAENGRKMLGGLALLVVTASFVALAWQQFLIRFSSTVIACMLWLTPVVIGFASVVYLSMGIIWLGVLGLLFALVSACYAHAVRDRIPFASANLSVACRGVSHFSPAVLLAAGAGLAAQFVWIMMWGAAVVGTMHSTANENGFVFFLLLVSFFWTATVITNVVHVTACGTIAAWWYGVDESPGKTVRDAAYRAVTTSFGSICFGSLIVAVLRASRYVVESARSRAQNSNHRDNPVVPFVLCITESLLRCMENVARYFNRWAYAFVALHGHDFKTAGKEALSLFENLGWTAIVNDDLIEHALHLGCMMTGAIVGVLGYSYGAGAGVGSDNATLLAVVGVFIGLMVSFVLFGLVDSAVVTVFVCFAENPRAFESNHPTQFTELQHAWATRHGSVMAACGYA